MKRIAFALAVVLLASCGPAKGTETPGTAALPVELAADEAYVLADAAILAAEKTATEGVTVAAGTKVKVLESDEWVDRVRTPDGKEGWMAVRLLAKDVRQAVLKSDDAASGWTSLTYIGYKPVDGDAATVDAFAASEDPGSPVRTARLPAAAISVDPNDINLVLLLRRARLADEPERTTLLNAALAKYSASAFVSLVQAELEKVSGKATVATRPASLIVTVSAEQAKVWSGPAEEGEPVATLASGEQAQVVEETVDALTVNGTQARWYKVADPAGWVFGADVRE